MTRSSPLKAAFPKTFLAVLGSALPQCHCRRPRGKLPGSTALGSCSTGSRRSRKSLGCKLIEQPQIACEKCQGQCGRGKGDALVVMEIIKHELAKTRIFTVSHHR